MSLDVCQHPWNYRVEPFRILSNLYYIGNRYVSSHLIDTGEGLIVLDTAFPQTVYLLLESIRRLGFNPDDIHYVLHCHAHYDHIGGTRAIVELTGGKTALGKEDIEVLQKRPELSWAPEYGLEFYETFEVDVPLVDGQTISLGHTSIECVHTPGHTAGCMSFFFEVEDDSVPRSVGIVGGFGLNTLTDAYLTRYALPLSRRASYLCSLERLKRRTVDIVIAPHPEHNDTLRKRDLLIQGQNPFVDGTAWPRFIETLEATAKATLGIS
jgi:metallo-beta-lactamase class B